MSLSVRPKQEVASAPDGDPTVGKNSYNNPAYYILEGVPNQSAAALPPELLPSPTSASKAPPLLASTRAKPPQPRRVGEEDIPLPPPSAATLTRPPPDFPPPPLPKGALLEIAVAAEAPPFPKPRPVYPDLAEVRVPPPSGPTPLSEGFRRGGGGGAGSGALDDQSCSVLQMAKTLSESEFQGPPPHRASPLRAPPPALDTCCTFPPRTPITESIAEDMPEEVGGATRPASPILIPTLQHCLTCVHLSFVSPVSLVFGFTLLYLSLLI